MLRLMLLRHAKTESDAPSGEDIDRRLDERGRDDAAIMGRWMAAHGIHADQVLVSTAVRTRQTWDIVAPLLGAPAIPVKHLQSLYLADPNDILAVIRQTASRPQPRRLLVIGHNPGMHELALALSGKGDAAARKQLGSNLPTSGLAVIDFAIEDWRDIGIQGGRLQQFVTPRLLKTAGIA